MLEEGVRKYGIGKERQMCVLLDRGGTVVRKGKKKIEKLDFGVVPQLVNLFRHLFQVLHVSTVKLMAKHYILI